MLPVPAPFTFLTVLLRDPGRRIALHEGKYAFEFRTQAN